MNKRAVQWALGCAVVGGLMLGFGIHDVIDFSAPSTDNQQVITLGQVIDLIVASMLLIMSALLLIGQVRQHRRNTKHLRWVREHPHNYID